MWLPDTISILSRFEAGDMRALFLRDDSTGVVGLTMFPAVLEPELPRNGRAWRLDSLIQLKCVGQAYAPFFAGGKTMRNSDSVWGLRFENQTVETRDGRTEVVTSFASDFGFRCRHVLSWREGEAFLESRTAVINTGGKLLSLEMLSRSQGEVLEEASTVVLNMGEKSLSLEMLLSFCLSGVSPFASDDAPGRLVLHRLGSAWCAEGRLRSESFEELQLEAFHPGAVASALRFGQVGSMPVRDYFPFLAVEDTIAGAVWGVQLAQPGSWQLEIGRRDDKVSLSGGLADREFGHWLKILAPGEAFESPLAILACVAGTVDDVCERLVGFQEREPLRPAPQEADLPIVFNEWCSSWGNPTHENMIALADKLRGTETGFLVMDAGWYRGHGDWLEDTAKFPDGLRETARAIRERGLVPGLWIELEMCESNSHAYHELIEWLLQRDGQPLETRTRRFFDFRQQWTHDYLSERVIELLRRTEMGYLKIDYNDTIGIGADGDDSLGESLRAHLEGVQRFWARVREELPDLVIENCASGGHRLEPSMMALCDQASFSDAHEAVSIPIIAANLHRAVLPRKSQIWAVLRPNDDERRLVYSLAATFLGRMCLSGDALSLNDAQWDIVTRGQRFYRQIWPVIANGQSRRFGPNVLSYRHPTGWQGVLRSNETHALVVCHRFGPSDSSPNAPLEIGLPGGREWRMVDTFAEENNTPRIENGALVCPLPDSWSACAVWLRAD